MPNASGMSGRDSCHHRDGAGAATCAGPGHLDRPLAWLGTPSIGLSSTPSARERDRWRSACCGTVYRMVHGPLAALCAAGERQAGGAGVASCIAGVPKGGGAAACGTCGRLGETREAVQAGGLLCCLYGNVTCGVVGFHGG